ncbi:hypothetical protein Aazo_2030 ['Nostoc azollae' 0708]|uniref:Uncharacterized protein n=1 Tax=Nostoc azollae (strain 0708) TaxID=551115 RepID=D7DWH2_NOSA0|nr:hypothetical protein Aazo_2030 ['Nostoc azollae' 0708]
MLIYFLKSYVVNIAPVVKSYVYSESIKLEIKNHTYPIETRSKLKPIVFLKLILLGFFIA